MYMRINNLYQDFAQSGHLFQGVIVYSTNAHHPTTLFQT